MAAFDYIKWKVAAKRKWDKYNFTAQWAKLDTAWTTADAGDVQTHAKDLHRRLKSAKYTFTKKNVDVDLNKMITGDLKPPSASSRELLSGAAGGTGHPQGTSKQTNQLLDMQASWFRDMLRWITCGADNDRRTYLPEFPDGLPADSDLYKDIRELAAEINKKIDAIPTPAVPCDNMNDKTTQSDDTEESLNKSDKKRNYKTTQSDDTEESLNKSDKKRFEKDPRHLKKDITVIHAEVLKFLTSFGTQEENKKGNSSDITAALVIRKINQCQQAAKRLQDQQKRTQTAVSRVYNIVVNKEAAQLPGVDDQLREIWEFLSKYNISQKSNNERVENLLGEKEEYNRRIESLNRERKDVQQAYRKCEDERNELVSRLSQFAGAQLLVNNPGIADLSDRDRPTKLAERYSELYDNEWTDAFMVLTDELKYDDRDAIDALLNIITGAFQYCASIGEKQKMDIERAISCPASEDKASRLPDIHSKTLTDLIKECADISEEDLLKTYTLQLEQCDTYDRNCLQQKKCKLYQEHCVSLCWKMALQSPPVYLERSVKKSKFDKKLYKPYQTTGGKVAYLVWPALYIHKDGQLLGKGVAECAK